MCLAAAVTLTALPKLVRRCCTQVLPRRAAQMAARSLLALTFVLIVGLSLTRTAALLVNYGAPMRIYKALPQVRSTGRRVHGGAKVLDTHPLLGQTCARPSHYQGSRART